MSLFNWQEGTWPSFTGPWKSAQMDHQECQLEYSQLHRFDPGWDLITLYLLRQHCWSLLMHLFEQMDLHSLVCGKFLLQVRNLTGDSCIKVLQHAIWFCADTYGSIILPILWSELVTFPISSQEQTSLLLNKHCEVSINKNKQNSEKLIPRQTVLWFTGSECSVLKYNILGSKLMIGCVDFYLIWSVVIRKTMANYWM